jgi:leader peptidase (prepilin peptidase)/N-methyltransferase
LGIIHLLFILAFGACVGSFLNVVIYRLPRGQNMVFPGSHCPKCGRAIRWFDNIPVVSWLVLRGRCRQCHKPISPGYPLVEASTAVLVGGLYVCYFWLDIRDGAGRFTHSWPMFVAHACLLAGLLACSIIDISHWIVPLEACWVVSAIALAVAAAAPPSSQFLPRVSPVLGAMGLAAAIGLGVSLLLQRMRLLQPSFIDARDPPLKDTGSEESSEPPPTVAISKAHGVNPRLEILREVLFLGPAVMLAAGAYLLVTKVPAAGQAWAQVSTEASGWPAGHFAAFQAALVGYLVGGAWIWGIRILGTLGFGKEAMGLGDAHILAAVGAVCGWIVPSLVFFIAPIFALLWALHLLLARRQRELPYGPWLATATLVVMLFYDGCLELLRPYFAAFQWTRT